MCNCYPCLPQSSSAWEWESDLALVHRSTGVAHPPGAALVRMLAAELSTHATDRTAARLTRQLSADGDCQGRRIDSGRRRRWRGERERATDTNGSGAAVRSQGEHVRSVLQAS